MLLIYETSAGLQGKRAVVESFPEYFAFQTSALCSLPCLCPEEEVIKRL